MTTGRWDELNYVVVDVEGNGNRPPDLVELAIVPILHGQIGEPRSWLVRPPHPIQWHARNIHGISNDDVAHAPTIAEVADDVLAALAAGVPVGHNAHVDLDVLTRSLPGWQPAEAFDTLKLARRAWNLTSYRLGALVRHRRLDADIPDGLRPHRAGYDALVTARLFVDLIASSAAGEDCMLDELRRYGLVAGLGTASTVAGRRPAASDPTLFDLP
ncbi:3'-5' exonuclease [Myceligenerans xiligouense]|uniref:DNA polymerase-3 subunit epsilon n=1 Tax=Myceligenerans xiligouense TaxID=253184 RepID=A0A3N4Z846_9MICO|nr:3'-5' exonuclease [Myceligenerans xiligouense]RPF21492.1 DNA polymerase-3 subunit epsilon [Myceligenerans xiligouense]